jgi:hypothetical protein
MSFSKKVLKPFQFSEIPIFNLVNKINSSMKECYYFEYYKNQEKLPKRPFGIWGIKDIENAKDVLEKTGAKYVNCDISYD